MPLSAVAPVPSTTALQLGPVSVEWMPVMVPAVTPVVELKDTAFRLQGKWLFVTVNIRPPGPVQLVNASDVIEPMPVPDSPLPLLSVAAPFEDAQDSETPLRVSVRVAFPDVAVVGPPGLTVQVAATAGAALRPITPAIAAPRKRTLPVRLRIAMGPISLIDLPIIQWRSGCWCLIRPRPTRAIHAGSLRAGTAGYCRNECLNPLIWGYFSNSAIIPYAVDGSCVDPGSPYELRLDAGGQE